MRKPLDLLALFLYCALIYWLSDQSQLPAPALFENEDKLHHFLAYFVMAVLVWRAFGHFIAKREQLFVAVLLFCSLYGISDEWHQAFIPCRDSSAMDWSADAIGSLAAAIFSYRYRTPASSRRD